MATVSSHILDSVRGTHAAGIRCQLFRLGDAGELLFDVVADAEGRVVENVDVGDARADVEYELVLHAADYFGARGLTVDTPMRTVVLRFSMRDETGRYHLPVMLSPHSYSTWWSG